jgi:hypothetical protein
MKAVEMKGMNLYCIILLSGSRPPPVCPKPLTEETTMGTVIRYRNLILFLTILSAIFAGFSVEAREDQEEILVGRIAHIEGKLLRFIVEEKDWVETVKDAPFGLEDALYSSEDAKAEFIMPNGTWLRVSENTQMQLIGIQFDATTVDVGSGLVRLNNKSDDAIIKVTTPFGYIVVPSDSSADLYIGDDSLEVIAVAGDVDFIHTQSEVRYTVQEGSFSIIADEREVVEGNGSVDSEWDNWNKERDDVWTRRQRSSRHSAGFLPEPIRIESAALEENGQWERLYYEGDYRDMWRPTMVDPGWRPFSVGRWTVYYGDNCWIPDESFGYVTHHFGSWVYIESVGRWYWAPPIDRVVAEAPGIRIRFGWYPGRVGWIHSGLSIGWVPLAPDEVYYGHRPWGHRTVVVNQSTRNAIDQDVARYRFLDEAVIIKPDDLYRGRSYAPVMQRNIRKNEILSSYKPTAVIDTAIVGNFNTDKRRFTYNDLEVTHKPHKVVVQRINENQNASRNIGGIRKERIERDLARFDIRTDPPRGDVRRPMLSTKIVPSDNIGKPLGSLSFERKEMKPKSRERELLRDDEQQSRLPERKRVGRPDQEANVPMRSPRDLRSDNFQKEGSAAQFDDTQRHRVQRDEGKPETIERDPGRDQLRLQIENQRNAEQEVQRRRQEGQQVRLKQERQLQQQEDQRVLEEIQGRKQKEGQRRQERELPDQQLERQQMRHKQDKQHQPQEGAEQQTQQTLKKKKKPQPEEELPPGQRLPSS